jgi:hypothetical protein
MIVGSVKDHLVVAGGTDKYLCPEVGATTDPRPRIWATGDINRIFVANTQEAKIFVIDF